jgi:hypothetical protein
MGSSNAAKGMEDLERYLKEMVQPTVDDFEANPTSRRHAFLACVVLLFQMRQHWTYEPAKLVDC